MTNIRLAVAQISSEKGDVDANITYHLSAIEQAARHNVSLIMFPELSLTGYEPELATSLAFTSDDQRLRLLKETAQLHEIWIVAGAPVKGKNGIEIGALIVSPEGDVSSYAKMYLHPGEDNFFVPGDKPRLLEIDDVKVAIAICADTNTPGHVDRYVAMGADVYMAGVLITDGGYVADTQQLCDYAKEHNVLVAMANHTKPTGGWKPIGKSAVWDCDGLCGAADETSDALIVASLQHAKWTSEVIPLTDSFFIAKE